jgi:hypothetical protein
VSWKKQREGRKEREMLSFKARRRENLRGPNHKRAKGSAQAVEGLGAKRRTAFQVGVNH